LNGYLHAHHPRNNYLWISSGAYAWGARADSEPPFKDYLTQPSVLKAPSRGSIAGEYAATETTSDSVLRGSFSLPLPLAFPKLRGPVVMSFNPTYSPSSGQTEWGMGFQNSLSIYRYNETGSIDFINDELMSPWGVLARGQSGDYYPKGFTQHVRVRMINPSELQAFLADGTKLIFGRGAHVETKGLGVYSWYLIQAENNLGQRTKYSYLMNPSGAYFLSEVLFGGRGEQYQYQIVFKYEDLKTHFFDYRSGARKDLDRRVQTVSLSTREARGVYAETFHYDLGYQGTSESPQFFLNSVLKTFASGAQEPKVTYQYNTGSDEITHAQWEHLTHLDSLLNGHGRIFDTDYSAMIDVNRDGLVSFEPKKGFRLIQILPKSYRVEPLGLRDPNNAPECRPENDAMSAPRQYVSVLGPKADAAVVRIFSDGHDSEIYACKRTGGLIQRFSVSGVWDQENGGRFVDLNNDGKPDLIRIYPGGYKLAMNQSDDAHPYRFSKVIEGDLEPEIKNTGFWIQDINGDGIPDLVARSESGSGIYVWYGKGNFEFDQKAEFRRFWTENGDPVDDIRNRSLTFADINHDGLTDILLSSAHSTRVFINDGQEFAEKIVPSIKARLGSDEVFPILADLKASGNAQISIVDDDKAYILELESPSTGLMTSATDGKGSLIQYQYERVAPTPGLGARPSVLSQVITTHSGMPNRMTQITLTDAKLHSKNNHLLGFSSVDIKYDSAEIKSAYLLDDDVRGLKIKSQETDLRQMGITRFEEDHYQESSVDGVRALLPKSQESGWIGVGRNTPYSSTKDILKYDDHFCPVQVSTRSDAGTLLQETSTSQVEGLKDHLHCMVGSVRLRGTHPDASFNFVHELEIARNQSGLPTQIIAHADGARVLQKIEYDANLQLKSVTTPSEGTTAYDYDPEFRLFSILEPSGHRISVSEWDPLTDGMRELREDRGDPTALAIQSFRYDERSRLTSLWSNLTGGDEKHPDQHFKYWDADLDHLGNIQSFKRFLTSANTSSFKKELEIFAANGKSLAQGEESETGLSLKQLSQLKTDEGVNHLGPKVLTHPITKDQWTMEALYQNDESVGEDQTSMTGLPIAKMVRFSEMARSVTDSSVSLDPLGLVVTHAQNKGSKNPTLTQIHLDLKNHTISFQDEEQGLYHFEYDVMGRLRRVLMPAGFGEARVDYNGFSDRLGVNRTGIGAIDFKIDPVTGRTLIKTYKDSKGEFSRSITYGYDRIGRVISENYQGLDKSHTQTFEYKFDGEHFDGSKTPGQLGFLSAEKGKGYTRNTRYRTDGKVIQEDLDLDHWASIRTTYTYQIDGSIQEKTDEIAGPFPRPIRTSKTEYKLDALGRLGQAVHSGSGAITVHYDGFNHPDQIKLPNGILASSIYDPVTQTQTALSRKDDKKELKLQWQFNDRGFIEQETYSQGKDQIERKYTFTKRGYLDENLEMRSSESANSRSSRSSYGYDVIGEIEQFKTDASSSQFKSSEGIFQAGDHRYAIDVAGQLTPQGEKWTYGPNGRVSKVAQIEYLYDPRGLRLLKLKDGRPVEAYLGDTLLSENAFMEPLKVGGLVFGVFINGQFRQVNTDRLGSLVSTDQGALDPAEPFGERTGKRSEISQTIDYVAKGYDPDLKAYRMGVRDYDPVAKRFLTADPLFLEQPEKCVESPVECNLYSYSRNNPGSFVDPTGSMAAAPHIIGAGISLSIWAYDELNSSKVAGDAIRPTSSPLDFFAGAGGAAVGREASSLFSSVSNKTVVNPVPEMFARVIPGVVGDVETLGGPRSIDVFVTGASDIRGMNASQVAERLNIPQSSSYKVIEFPSSGISGVASPIFRENPGFVGGGKTAGGAREFVIPNQEIPTNAATRTVH